MHIDIGAIQLSSIDIGAFQGQPLGQLFVSNVKSILTSDLNGSNPSLIIRDGDSGLRLVGAYYLDIDTINSKLFFMILGFPSLCRMSNLDGTSLENVEIDTGSSFSFIPSIAIDNSSTITTTNNGNTITGPRVFIADYSNNRIGIGNIVKRRILGLDDFTTTIVINSFINTVSSPVVIKYDSENNILFWTESNESINKTATNGSIQRLDIAGNSFSLAIDPIRRKLYYSGVDRIGGLLVEGIIQSDYNGSSLSLIHNASPDNRYKFNGIGIDTYSNNLYWTVTSDNQLYYKDLSSSDSSSIILTEDDGLDNSIDVKIYLFESSDIQFVNKQKSLFIKGKNGPIEGISTPPPLPPPSTPSPPPFIGSPPSPPGPPIEDEEVVVITSLSLFLDAPESATNEIQFFIGSPQTENYLNLYLHAPVESIGLIEFFLQSPNGETLSSDFFICGIELVNEDINLFCDGIGVEINTLELFIEGKENLSNNLDFYITARDNVSDNIDLHIIGKDIEANNFELLIRGVITSPDFVSSISAMGLIEHDYSLEEPVSIIGNFDTGRVVTISIWLDGLLQTISSNICNEVDATGKYAWSISNIPVLVKDRVQYHYRMIDDLLNIVDGDFILFSKEAKDGSMPSLNTKNEYISVT